MARPDQCGHSVTDHDEQSGRRRWPLRRRRLLWKGDFSAAVRLPHARDWFAPMRGLSASSATSPAREMYLLRTEPSKDCLPIQRPPEEPALSVSATTPDPLAHSGLFKLPAFA